MREDEDQQADMTLTGRVGRLEQFMRGEFGMGLRDEGDSINGVAARQYRKEEAAMQQPLRPDVSGIEAIIDRIQTGSTRVCQSAARLEEIGTRIMGAIPEDRADAATTPAPDGTLNLTFMALDWFDNSLDRLERAVQRIENV